MDFCLKGYSQVLSHAVKTKHVKLQQLLNLSRRLSRHVWFLQLLHAIQYSS